MSSPSQSTPTKKETQFFLFTDWDQTHASPAAPGVDQWPPFVTANSNDKATVKDVKNAINIRLDTRLNGVVDPPDRVYFGHTNRGVGLISNDPAPHWEFLQGAIVDLDTASRGENSSKLSALAKGLARKAPQYIRDRSSVLVCLLPGPSTGLTSVFTMGKVFKLTSTKDSKSLIAELVVWLTDLNTQIEDDRMNAPEELREAVEEFLEKILI